MATNEAGLFKEAGIHFVGGAFGGTVGTAATCPFEVIKTRMQSARGFEEVRRIRQQALQNAKIASTMAGTSGNQAFIKRMGQISGHLWRAHYPPLWCISLKVLWNEGGLKAFYKGLLPNICGVTPSKAVYFASYSVSKRLLNEQWTPDTAKVHLCSAGIGGLCAATCMNPIWVIKTRMQLHQARLGFRECSKRIWQREGLKGLFKGVTGSYLGIVETMVQFCLYEWFRAIITDPERKFFWLLTADQQHLAFGQFMLAGGIAKTGAVIIAYPHEIFRTRLREEANQLNFRGIFWDIWKKHPFWGLYRGLSVQLVRSVPNTAVTMLIYELTVHGLHIWFPPSPIKDSNVDQKSSNEQ